LIFYLGIRGILTNGRCGARPNRVDAAERMHAPAYLCRNIHRYAVLWTIPVTFKLKKKRKIFIFNYLKIWSVRVLLDLIIIISKCEPIFIILILLFMQLHILIIIRFTDRFLFGAVGKLPININLGLDITLTLYLLDEFIFNNISMGFGNIQM
jgi:hypothetical protein